MCVQLIVRSSRANQLQLDTKTHDGRCWCTMMIMMMMLMLMMTLTVAIMMIMIVVVVKTKAHSHFRTRRCCFLLLLLLLLCSFLSVVLFLAVVRFVYSLHSVAHMDSRTHTVIKLLLLLLLLLFVIVVVASNNLIDYRFYFCNLQLFNYFRLLKCRRRNDQIVCDREK